MEALDKVKQALRERVKNYEPMVKSARKEGKRLFVDPFVMTKFIYFTKHQVRKSKESKQQEEEKKEDPHQLRRSTSTQQLREMYVD